MTDAEIAEEAARITALELADHIARRIDATDAALIRAPGERFLRAQR